VRGRTEQCDRRSILHWQNQQHEDAHYNPIPVQIRSLLTFNESDFELSPEFREALGQPSRALIIILVGGDGVGTSGRLNQIVIRNLRMMCPFRSEPGTSPVTDAFQFCGPIKFADFGRLDGIDFRSTKDPDIFMVDCEGLYALSQTAPGAKKAAVA
jgi:hypothetical protein